MPSYAEAGVDIGAGNRSVELIKKAVKSTYNAQVLTKTGSFGGAYSLSKIMKMKGPVLVSTIDGVGTKLKVASKMDSWGTVGEDIVNHCANDILALGARPLFFLDYIASDRLVPENVREIVNGMAKACRENSCALIGGETAEMPAVYSAGEHDVAGCMTGVVEKSAIIDGSKIRKGDSLIGVASNGLHTNGYSLARSVFFEKAHMNHNDYFKELAGTLGEELLRVHKSYSKSVLSLTEKTSVKGIAHITGGGLSGNVPRIMPEGLAPEFDLESISVPKIFGLIKDIGKIDDSEMFRVFNMGVGLVLVVSPKDARNAIDFLNRKGENAWLLGKVVPAREASLGIPELP